MQLKLPSNIGKAGWYLILGVVVAIDVPVLIHNQKYPDDQIWTISEWCWDSLNHPKKKWVTWFTIAAVAKHLAAPNTLRKADPIGLIGLGVRTLVKRG